MLSLRCKLHPAAVPLLARLPRLANLQLHLLADRGTDDWSSAGAVAAALLPLMLGAPSLKRVDINLVRYSGAEADSKPPLAAVREGVLRLREQLQRLGRDPLMVAMQS